MATFFPSTPDQSPDHAIVAATMPKVTAFLELLDRHVAATGFMAGDCFTYADMAILPMLHYLSETPESKAVLATCKALSAYLATHSARPSMVKTAPPPMAELLAVTHGMIRIRMAAEAAAETT